MSDDKVSPELSPDDVHSYWFAGTENDARASAERMSFWFQGSDATDAEVRAKFAAHIQPAADGDYSHWGRNARECLSLIILLDQFPRNVYRGKAMAFDFDALALGLTIVGVKMGYLDELSPIEQVFFLMPYQHVEDIERQRDGIKLYEAVTEAAPPEWQQLTAGCCDFARQHLEIIEEFGRFPHRNTVLGRTSTPAEQAYIDGGGASFGQSSDES